MERTHEKRDELTGRTVLVLPRYNEINVHSYYSKHCFSWDNRFTAVASCALEGPNVNDRTVSVPGRLHVMSFPDGEPRLTLNDVPVARHAGNQYEFIPGTRKLAVHLAEGTLGIVDLDDWRVTEIPVRGEWRSVGVGGGGRGGGNASAEGGLIRFASSAPDGMFLTEIDSGNRVVSERPLATEDVLAAASHSVLPEKDRLTPAYGNVKISPDARSCMFVRRLKDQDGSIRCKELFIAGIDAGTVRWFYGGDDMQFSNPKRSFHHAAWQLGANRILYHAPSEPYLQMTFRLYDAETDADDVVFPLFGARGHHSLLTSDGHHILTDSYNGDLAGIVSVLNLSRATIHPVASWLLSDHLVDGHAALSDDERWVLYSCNVDGGSEVRAVRYPEEAR